MKTLLFLALSFFFTSCAFKKPIARHTSLSKSQIDKVIHGYRVEVQSCFDNAMKKNPNFSGDVAVAFAIQPSGNILDCRVKDRTIIEDEKLESCLASRCREWIFPPADGVTKVERYPLTSSVTSQPAVDEEYIN